MQMTAKSEYSFPLPKQLTPPWPWVSGLFLTICFRFWSRFHTGCWGRRSAKLPAGGSTFIPARAKLCLLHSCQFWKLKPGTAVMQVTSLWKRSSFATLLKLSSLLLTSIFLEHAFEWLPISLWNSASQQESQFPCWLKGDYRQWVATNHCLTLSLTSCYPPHRHLSPQAILWGFHSKQICWMLVTEPMMCVWWTLPV